MDKCPSCEVEFRDDFNYCPNCGKRINPKNVFNSFRKKVSDTIDRGIGTTKNSFEDILNKNPELRRKFEESFIKIADNYNESKYKGYVDITREKTSQQFDIVSGKAMYDLVEERIAIQNKYNDLMATKLHEALQKITELEERIQKMENKNED